MSNHQKENNNHPNHLDSKYGLRKWVFRSILFVVLIGALGPFIAQCILTCVNSDADGGLSMWNQYVGIILGIVATILSIVSMIMGFSNYDETLSQQHQYLDTLNEIKKIARDVNDVKSQVCNMGQKNDTTTTKELDNETPWDQKTKEE